jgi:hypothetical protein
MKIILSYSIESHLRITFVTFEIFCNDTRILYCFGSGFVGVSGTCFNNNLFKLIDWEAKYMRKVGRVIYNYELILKKEHKE